MRLEIANKSIMSVRADLIALKFAEVFRGADLAVATALGFTGKIPKGEYRVLESPQLGARQTLFLSVGRLHDFQYAEIQCFARRCLEIAVAQDKSVKHVAMTIHGPGYGLDPTQSFLAQLAGLAEFASGSSAIHLVTIAEADPRRAELLTGVLREHGDVVGIAQSSIAQPFQVVTSPESEPALNSNVVNFGARASKQPKLFVAMPFDERYWDEFEIAFQEAAYSNGFLCERLELEAFVGDIGAEIVRRINLSAGVIALLNGQNANVFFELGFAVALRKPAVLVVADGERVPFDVRGHRCIRYKNISGLRSSLTKELSALKAQGVFAQNAQ